MKELQSNFNSFSDDCTPLGPYWRSSSKNSEEFIVASKEFFNKEDKSGLEYYLNGSTSTMLSGSLSRYNNGIQAAESEILKIKKLIEERKKSKDPLTEINFVTHSMGAAYSEGLIVEMLKDPILKSLLINGEIVHFSAADAGDIPKRSDGLKRYQINYKWDYTLAYADGWNDGDGYGGERLDGANKRAVVFAESFEQQLNTLHNGQTDWDFHFDTKTYKNDWDALIILKDQIQTYKLKKVGLG